MTDKQDLIREIHEYVNTHGGENTATHLLVQAASAIQTQAADSVLEYTVLLKEARGALWQPAHVALCERIDAYLDAARKEAESHDKT